jgi:hypothetical protein
MNQRDIGPVAEAVPDSILLPATKSPADLAGRFHALFCGSGRAHGTYNNINFDARRSDGKYKGEADTKREPVTDVLWQQHLDGRSGLGVIPIRDDSTCTWGAVDVDVYADLDPARVASTVAKFRLPLVVCRSKSGGVHLYCFARCPVPASDMQVKLQGLAAKLGHGTAEIFPKQTTICVEKQDLGSWINMPYFHALETNRYAVRPTGDAMTAEEFLEFAEAARQPAEWFTEALPQAVDALPDGPPCLQHLMEMGFPPGTWNTGVFNLGVYARKAHPDNWETHLVQLNAIHFPADQWPQSDLNDIKKSLKKRNYAYQCSEQPLARFCDRATCRKRKYGVGGANALPALSSLSQLATEPPVWFLDVEGHRLEMSTRQLLNPLDFQELCAHHLVLVPVVGRAAWIEHLRPYMAKANCIPVADDGSDDDDSSTRTLFLEQLEEFCTGRACADTLDNIRTGRPYTADGLVHFRLAGLMQHLSRKGFKNFTRQQAVAILKDYGAKNRQARVAGLVTRVWTVPEFAREPAASDPASF